MNCFAGGRALALFGAIAAHGAQAADCAPANARSPQFTGPDCTFQNLPNPQLKPNRSNWDIWSRLLLEKKQGTVPVDPIPVRAVTRASLDALDPAANHVIRLGHSSHLLKLRG